MTSCCFSFLIFTSEAKKIIGAFLNNFEMLEQKVVHQLQGTLWKGKYQSIMSLIEYFVIYYLINENPKAQF